MLLNKFDSVFQKCRYLRVVTKLIALIIINLQFSLFIISDHKCCYGRSTEKLLKLLLQVR